MKKWNKPELLTLGVENTFTGEHEVDPLHSFGNHYCHEKSEWHEGNCEKGAGHTAINLGECVNHKTGTPNHPEYSCCCYVKTSTDTGNGGIGTGGIGSLIS